MGRTLARRGPDAAGELVGGAYGLGHRLRGPSSETKPAQPFSRGGCAIVADVRLDHRTDLLRSLDLVAGGRGPPDDAELVLRAYQRWGRSRAGRGGQDRGRRAPGRGPPLLVYPLALLPLGFYLPSERRAIGARIRLAR